MGLSENIWVASDTTNSINSNEFNLSDANGILKTGTIMQVTREGGRRGPGERDVGF